ncbi:MAG: hypothetical protein HY664_00870 [Chloroflexi bacterium]|nr:hypothetical protein [Chloroflexota bacterium]
MYKGLRAVLLLRWSLPIALAVLGMVFHFVEEFTGLLPEGLILPLDLFLFSFLGPLALWLAFGATARYLTQREKAEAELTQTKGELEARLAEVSQAREELTRAEKLAAVGELASTVGHELRNPLAVMRNAAYYLGLRLGNGDERVKRHLEILDKEVTKANNIISDLLDFSRPKAPVFAKVEINSLVEEALSRVEMGENIEMVRELGGGLPLVEADGEQIGRVFLNFILNAVQAMPQGGRLVVRTRNEGCYLVVEIGDSGVGIAEENLIKIFEPLFTTKAKGAGLGLTLCRSIVNAHQGTIEVKSRLGEGATFVVGLPLTRGECSHEHQSQNTRGG